MIELVKQCLHKPTRKATLMKQELEDVILDRKKNLSNLPLMLKDVNIPSPKVDKRPEMIQNFKIGEIWNFLLAFNFQTLSPNAQYCVFCS